MGFGFALLAGLLGYAVVDCFDSDEGREDSSDEDNEVSLDALDTVTSDSSSATEVTEDPDIDTGAVIEGTDGDDLIYGGHANDVIYGGDGNYTINGGNGADQLRGGDGSNTINGDGGDDLLYAGGGNVDQSSNVLNGGDGNDTLYGSNKPYNLLNGEVGDDEIHMYGRDTATGGEGSDIFYFSTINSNDEVSTITDYNAAEDQLIIEYTTGLVSSTTTFSEAKVSIQIDGKDAIVYFDGEDCVVVQGAASSLTVEDIILRPSSAL